MSKKKKDVFVCWSLEICHRLLTRHYMLECKPCSILVFLQCVSVAIYLLFLLYLSHRVGITSLLILKKINYFIPWKLLWEFPVGGSNAACRFCPSCKQSLVSL